MISGYILNYEGTQTSKSLHWPMSDLTEQVTCWGNTFFFFLIKPGHSNAYLLTKQGATQLDFHKRAASLKNLCLCSERWQQSEGMDETKVVQTIIPGFIHVAAALTEGVLVTRSVPRQEGSEL